MTQLRYRVVVDGELLARLPPEADTWFRGRLLATSLAEAVGEPVRTIMVVPQYHFATDRTVFRTDDPETAAVLTALQDQGYEGMLKAIRMMECRHGGDVASRWERGELGGPAEPGSGLSPAPP